MTGGKKRTMLLALGGVLALVGGAAAFWQLTAPKAVLLVGDCITFGYAEPLRAKLGPGYAVWHDEHPTGTICNLLSHVEERVISQKADIIVLNVGLHDVTRKGEVIGPRCTPKEYRQGVAGLLALLRKHTRARLIWATCTPCVDRITHDFRSNADIDIINAISRDEAQKAGVEVVDLNALLRGSVEELTRDGTHYKPAGYKMMAMAIADTILP